MTINLQKTIQDQKNLLEILKPMNPKERFEYNKKRLDETRDLLRVNIEKFEKEHPYAPQRVAADYITKKYFNSWTNQYNVSLSDMALGKLYTFDYPIGGSLEVNDRGTRVPSDRMPYFDPNPIIIYCGHATYKGEMTHRPSYITKNYTKGNQLATGINLNYLGPYLREIFLNAIVEEWKEDMYNSKSYSWKHSFTNFQSYYEHMAETLNYLDIADIVVRRYWTQNMHSIRMISWKDITQVAIMGTSNITRYR